MRTFKTPAAWGIGPGPAKLYSVDHALSAIRMWLDLTPARRETVRERELMLTLRAILEHVPDDAAEADLMSAKRAIKGMVKYSLTRDAQNARMESYAIGTRATRLRRTGLG